MNLRIIYLGIILGIEIVSSNANACSAFTMKSKTQVFMCKSYDWNFSDGVLIFNPRNIQKRSMPVIGNYNGINWQSKYSSLTFNQYGQSLPNGGINEKGLAIEILWLNETNYGAVSNQTCLNELQWIQYGLDNCSTVEELIDITSSIKISALYAKVHYYISDAEGNAAVVEFIKGKRIVSTGKNLTCSAITNSTYNKSIIGLNTDTGCRRFRTLNTNLTNDNTTLNKSQMFNRGFKILDEVKSKSRTQWQIVYDLKNQGIQFRTKDNLVIKSINLHDFKPEIANKTLYIDLNTGAYIPVHKFKEINLELNEKILTNAFEKLQLPVPENAKNILAEFITSGKANHSLQEIIKSFDKNPQRK